MDDVLGPGMTQGVSSRAMSGLKYEPLYIDPNVESLLENKETRQHPIPVDPAGGHCYLNSAKPCQSDRKVGVQLSNT